MTKRNMKDSGVEWIGEIPEDWELKRIQWGLQEINKKNNPIQTTNILSLMKDVGVIPYENKGDVGNKSKDDITGYKLAYPHTIVVNSMNVIIGSVGISNYLGCVSPVYYIYKSKADIDIRFFNYIFQTRQFQKELKKYSNGILEIRLRVSSDNILKRKVPFPTYYEQIRISDKLDEIGRKIDKIIKTINQEVSCLQNIKKSLITEAVTKGLDKDVTMKDSGIEWIGEIPEHWYLEKLKFITKSILKGISPNYKVEGPVSIINQATFSQGYFDYENLKYSDDSLNSESKAQKGDILIATTGGGVLGKTYYFMEEGDFLASTDVAILRFNDTFLSKYVYYFYSVNYDLLNGEFAKGSTNQTHLQMGLLANMKLPLPNRDEIREIVDYLDSIIKNVDEVIRRKHQQIRTLEEYKKSLIYEYVTGKKELSDG